VSINSCPDYKHVLQENYMEYKYIFLPLLKLVSKKLLELSYIKKKYVCIPCSFLVINVCKQGKTLCSPCGIKFLKISLFCRYKIVTWKMYHIKSDFFV